MPYALCVNTQCILTLYFISGHQIHQISDQNRFGYHDLSAMLQAFHTLHQSSKPLPSHQVQCSKSQRTCCRGQTMISKCLNTSISAGGGQLVDRYELYTDTGVFFAELCCSIKCNKLYFNPLFIVKHKTVHIK